MGHGPKASWCFLYCRSQVPLIDEPVSFIYLYFFVCSYSGKIAGHTLASLAQQCWLIFFLDVELFGQENRKAEEWKIFVPLICASFGNYGNLEGGRSSGN